MSKSECNYATHKLEFLALKWSITQKFNDYLYGNRFVGYSDNNPVTYVLTSAKLDATSQRWIAGLAAYDFEIRYRPGKHNADADALSRLPGFANPEQEYETIGPEVLRAICKSRQIVCYMDTLSFSVTSPDESTPEVLEDTCAVEWMRRQQQDPAIRKFLCLVTRKEKVRRDKFTTTEGKLLFREVKNFIVKRGFLYRQFKQNETTKFQLVLPEKYRNTALEGAHDDVGHLGRERGLAILRDRFHWPHMARQLEECIARCDRCIKRKSPTNNRAPLVSIRSSQPFELVCTDCLTLESSKGGFQHILIITDHFTKYVVGVPTKTAKTTADAIYNNFVVHCGFPARLHSDQ